MSSGTDPSPLHDPWRFIAVAAVSAIVVVAFGLGFLLLPRYQGMHAPSSAKDSLYHALGLHMHGRAFDTIQPPVKIPTHIVLVQPEMER
jgi:hypothetical protein